MTPNLLHAYVLVRLAPSPPATEYAIWLAMRWVGVGIVWTAVLVLA